MKIRIKFRKYGIMKFIGHLDIMRYFQKAMRRADIDICYSAGFSPHMIMSFASPLGVGLTSDGEYLDIEIGNELSSEAAVKRLNGVMAEGVAVLSVAGEAYADVYKRQRLGGSGFAGDPHLYQSIVLIWLLACGNSEFGAGSGDSSLISK